MATQLLSKKASDLITRALEIYIDSEKVNALEGKFKYYGDNIRTNGSDEHYCFNESSGSFYYDEENDTLCNWGRGLGLIYRKGEWAIPRDRIWDITIQEKELNYEIY